MSRSPYSVLPTRPVRIASTGLAEALDVAGPNALRTVLRDRVLAHVSGRPSTPAEVRFLREWVEVETAEQAAFWLARLAPAHP